MSTAPTRREAAGVAAAEVSASEVEATASAGAAPGDDSVDGPEQAWPLAEAPLSQPLNALAIDTTSDVLSLAVLRAGTPAGALYEPLGRRTTQEILPRLAALLRGAGLTPAALDVLVVARGPGSFTGTRIGMAVALTFVQVSGRPLLGVDTLRLMAAQTTPRPGTACAVLLNCARDEVYCARYRWEGGGLAREGGIALHRLRDLLPELGTTPVVLRRYRPGVGTAPEDEAAFAALPRAPLLHAQPDGPRLLAVGLGRYRAEPGCHGAPPGHPVPAGAGVPPVPRLEPIYLKSEAFRTWRPS